MKVTIHMRPNNDVKEIELDLKEGLEYSLEIGGMLQSQ